MLRARGHYRWVAVLDFDEYLVPKQATTIGQLFQQAHMAAGQCSSQYIFTGRVVCSGCRHQYHNIPGLQDKTGTAVQQLPVSEQPNPNSTAACLQPTVGFHHMLWSTVIADTTDHVKSVVGPMAVTLPGVHTSPTRAYNNCSGTVQLAPAQVGVQFAVQIRKN
jgi:hypothetical protein